MKWEEETLAFLCEIGDGAHASLKRIDKGITYITAKNITNEGLNLNKVDYHGRFTKMGKNGFCKKSRKISTIKMEDMVKKDNVEKKLK